MIAGIDGVTGVSELSSVRGTIELVLSLHPGTEEVVVINNTRNVTDRLLRERLLFFAPQFQDRVRFTYWDNLPLEEMTARLQKLAAGQVVLMNSSVIYQTEGVLSFSEGAARIRQASVVPIYGLWDFSLGKGIVGGGLVSSIKQGELAAKLALRILQGENPDDIPMISNEANEYMFDYRELQRFGIALESLPEGSFVVYKPLSFYQINKKIFWAVLGVAAGLVVFSAILLRNIFSRKRAEEELRDSEEKYRLLFSAESDAILIFDMESQAIEEVNTAATHLYGYSKEEFQKLSMMDLSSEPEKARERIRETMAGRQIRIPMARHQKKDGTGFPAEISFGSFMWKKHRMLVAIIRDITERQKIDQMKDEMLSAVSHEMSTPLTAMLGFAEFMLDNEVDIEQQREYLEIIFKESDRLKGLIDNLLSLQRLRAGFGRGNFQAVAILPLLIGVARLLERFSKKHKIVIDSPSDLPPLLGDEGMLHQALENLLSNAIKYSPDGGTVTLGARSEEECVTLWVKDEGPGIPQGDLDHIFDRFFRIDTKNKRRIGGSGLGLPLVKEIAKLHNGRVWVESVLDKGSSFYMRLPLREAGNQDD